MRRTCGHRATGDGAAPLTTWTTLTTTAASPGHFSRRVRAKIAPPSEDLFEPRRARVALADGVGRDQPEQPPVGAG